jgi:coenzyme F420-reducing hydrogenase gamma subunit
MKPAIAVHKFASCSGCQLAFINMGEDLLILKELVDIVHFPEAGPLGAEVPVDIAFIEGSVISPEDVERLQKFANSANIWSPSALVPLLAVFRH